MSSSSARIGRDPAFGVVLFEQVDARQLVVFTIPFCRGR